MLGLTGDHVWTATDSASASASASALPSALCHETEGDNGALPLGCEARVRGGIGITNWLQQCLRRPPRA